MHSRLVEKKGHTITHGLSQSAAWRLAFGHEVDRAAPALRGLDPPANELLDECIPPA
jgi:hypothetical protein